MLSLLLSLIFLISKKREKVLVVTVEDKVSFVINSSEADVADLGLKIRIFAVAKFCFTKVFFSLFLSYSFIRAFFVD